MGRHFRQRLVAVIGVMLVVATSAVASVGVDAAPRLRAAQNMVDVPTLTGLTVPQAVQALNKVSLNLGDETSEAWTADSNATAGQISAQQPDPSVKLPSGAFVDVTVPRKLNATVFFDGLAISVLNGGGSGDKLDLRGVTFGNLFGDWSFDPRDWDWALGLPSGLCNQVWASRPSKFTLPEECKGLRRALVLADNSLTPWQRPPIRVEQNRNLLRVCESSPCPLEVPQNGESEYTIYWSFTYRTNHLEVRNTSDKWMSLAGARIIGLNNMRATLNLPLDGYTAGDLAWAGPVGARLAPGQCLVFSDQEVKDLPAFDCTVMDYVKVPQGKAFWTRGFIIIGPQHRGACSAPRPGLQSECRVRR